MFKVDTMSLDAILAGLDHIDVNLENCRWKSNYRYL